VTSLHLSVDAMLTNTGVVVGAGIAPPLNFSLSENVLHQQNLVLKIPHFGGIFGQKLFVKNCLSAPPAFFTHDADVNKAIS